jgi:hypothetical protein
MLRTRSMLRRLPLGAFLLFLTLGACRDNPAGPPPESMAVLRLSANVAGTAISQLVVEVTAEDLAAPLVFNLEIAQGRASGTLRVPPGSARTFRALAYESGGEVTHEGSHTADVRRGENPPIRITLLPRLGEVEVTVTLAPLAVEVGPAEARLEVGDTLRLSAVVRDVEGRPVAGRVEWASLNPALAVVSREGVVTARREGTVQIVASFAGVAGSARLIIEEVPPPVAQIAFVSDRSGNSEIYLMNADGSGLRNLTNHPAGDGSPAWYRDGIHLAFVSNRNGLAADIYVMDTFGLIPRRLTNHPTTWDGTPTWSPDGNRIAFGSTRDGNNEIYVMNADGTDQVRLTNHPAHDRSPAWSPDGRHIAFVSDRDGPSEIYVMEPDGSDVRRLTHTGAWHGGVAWSSDGSRIAFNSNYHGSLQVYVMDADGYNLRRLTDHPADDWTPSWSPDGRHIAFMSTRDGNWEIYVMNADGSAARRLTDHPAPDSWPAWRP